MYYYDNMPAWLERQLRDVPESRRIDFLVALEDAVSDALDAAQQGRAPGRGDNPVLEDSTIDERPAIPWKCGDCKTWNYHGGTACTACDAERTIDVDFS